MSFRWSFQFPNEQTNRNLLHMTFGSGIGNVAQVNYQHPLTHKQQRIHIVEEKTSQDENSFCRKTKGPFFRYEKIHDVENMITEMFYPTEAAIKLREEHELTKTGNEELLRCILPWIEQYLNMPLLSSEEMFDLWLESHFSNIPRNQYRQIQSNLEKITEQYFHPLQFSVLFQSKNWIPPTEKLESLKQFENVKNFEESVFVWQMYFKYSDLFRVYSTRIPNRMNDTEYVVTMFVSPQGGSLYYDINTRTQWQVESTQKILLEKVLRSIDRSNVTFVFSQGIFSQNILSMFQFVNSETYNIQFIHNLDRELSVAFWCAMIFKMKFIAFIRGEHLRKQLSSFHSKIDKHFDMCIRSISKEELFCVLKFVLPYVRFAFS